MNISQEEKHKKKYFHVAVGLWPGSLGGLASVPGKHKCVYVRVLRQNYLSIYLSIRTCAHTHSQISMIGKFEMYRMGFLDAISLEEADE